MIDYLVLALTHAVMLLAFWRMLERGEELDSDAPVAQDADPTPEPASKPRRAMKPVRRA